MLTLETLKKIKEEAEYRHNIWRPMKITLEEIAPVLDAAEWALKDGYQP